MKYLVIYPPIGRQQIGNCEVIESDNGIPSMLLQQAELGQVKVVIYKIQGGSVKTDIFQELEQINQSEPFLQWKQIKTLSDKDQT